MEWTRNNIGWDTVNIEGSFTNPVVVMSPPTINGGDQCVVRLRNVTPTSFQYTLQEWAYLEFTE